MDLSKEDFENLFTGKYDVACGENYEEAVEFVSQHKQSLRVAQTCMVFFSKPIDFLVTGKTNADKGDGRPVDDRLLEYLPKHKEKPTCSAKWRENKKFELLNVQMIRRIALLSFQYGHSKDKLVSQFWTKYGRPTDLASEAIEQNEHKTKEILREACVKFDSQEHEKFSHIHMIFKEEYGSDPEAEED